MPISKKKPLLNKKQLLRLNINSERVVVDEIMDDGTARLLRSAHLHNAPPDDLGINNWGDEKEDVVSAWRVEAFVGYETGQRLSEGDVFFIVDGSKLTNQYKPIQRSEARKLHLLISSDESRKIARREIKEQFYKLAASQMTTLDKEKKVLINRVEKKFKTDTSASE